MKWILMGATVMLCSLAMAAETEVAEPVLAENPQPEKLPTLSAHKVEWTPGRTMTMVRIKAPNIPDFTCDVWCYESAYGPGEAEADKDGSLTLRQKSTREDGHVAVTRIVPEEGAVLFEVTVDVRDEADAGTVGAVNPCWQLGKAPGFSSAGADFPEFVARCFVFTEEGCVHMDQTERFPDTRRPDDHNTNTPPWVQVYFPTWREHPGQPEAFWGVSTDQYTLPLIGCVSKDGEHLVAVGTTRNSSLCQGWHDCLHPIPPWEAYEEGKPLRARFRIYLMDNDVEALVDRYTGDFEWTAEDAEGQ